MNLLSFMKRKEDKEKAQKNMAKMVRLDTQAQPIVNKRLKTEKKALVQTSKTKDKAQKAERMATTYNQSVAVTLKTSKVTLQIKQILLTLWTLKNQLDKQYDCLLNPNPPSFLQQQAVELLATNHFRFRRTSFVFALNQYANILQALELLISKLSNNEKLSEKIMIRNEEDFVLFFKFFFSKPYTLINLPSVRKVIKLLWDQCIFASLTTEAMIGNLKLWIFGIAAPLNPSMNKLHRISTESSEQITKIVNHRSNQCVYVGVNQSDAICLTPLMVAAISRNIKGIEKLIKSGADPYCCPLVFSTKKVSSAIQNSKSADKLFIKKSFGLRERLQPNLFQILRNDSRVEEIAQVVCWQSLYNMKRLRKDAQLSETLSNFPDCSFQISWKQYRNVLSFKQLPQDIISVFKRKHCLRIDFHVADLELTDRNLHGHYSLILKAEPLQEVKLYIIDHRHRTIKDLMEDKDLAKLKEKYTTLLKHGNIYDPQIAEIKALYYPKEDRLSLSLQTYYQNINKFSTFKFRTEKQYFQQVINSDLINYRQLQKNQIQAVLAQNIVSAPKVKSKTVESCCSAEIQWSAQNLNLTHLALILRVMVLVFPNSIFLNKVQLVCEVFEDPVMKDFGFAKKLPVRCKFAAEGDINIQSQIKNVNYVLLQQSIFNLEVRAKQLLYEEGQEPIDLSHMQDTLYLDEVYSISASQFLGKSQNLFQFAQNQANLKFEQLILQDQLWSAEDDQK